MPRFGIIIELRGYFSGKSQLKTSSLVRDRDIGRMKRSREVVPILTLSRSQLFSTHIKFKSPELKGLIP